MMRLVLYAILASVINYFLAAWLWKTYLLDYSYNQVYHYSAFLIGVPLWFFVLPANCTKKLTAGNLLHILLAVAVSGLVGRLSWSKGLFEAFASLPPGRDGVAFGFEEAFFVRPGGIVAVVLFFLSCAWLLGGTLHLKHKGKPLSDQ